MWKFDQVSHHSEGGGLGSLRARFELTSGPSTPAAILASFTCPDSSLSGIDFELIGLGYRVSLVKKHTNSGKIFCFNSI